MKLLVKLSEYKSFRVLVLHKSDQECQKGKEIASADQKLDKLYFWFNIRI